MPDAQILIVEDDADLRTLLRRGLSEEGFGVETVTTGADLLRQAARRSADLLVVDIGLPDADGRDVCQALRAHGIDTPVLFLTARDAVVDRVAGLSAGGDDYLVKPFSFDELVARLRALLRRLPVDRGIDAGAMRLDPTNHAAHVGTASAQLTPTEFRLLAALAGRSGQVVRRQELIQTAWPVGAIVHDNTLDAYIARLRRKLRALASAPEIHTAHGVGYRLS
jgi:two-component system OmpR family response regulator